MFVFDSRMATVRPYLLLGAAAHENDYAMLREAGVTHILQVGAELKPSFPGRFQYLRISLDDAEQQDIISVLPRCFAFIQDARQQGEDDVSSFEPDNPTSNSASCYMSSQPTPASRPPPPSTPSAPTPVVLVHCAAGMSRSASVVLAYLMWAEKLPYSTAFQQVKAARPCIYPNLGFLLQLWEWEAGCGCDAGRWPGWNKTRFAERLAEYRRAQAAAGLHPAVRVPLPLQPPAAAHAAPPPPPPPPAACSPAAASTPTGAAAAASTTHSTRNPNPITGGSSSSSNPPASGAGNATTKCGAAAISNHSSCSGGDSSCARGQRAGDHGGSGSGDDSCRSGGGGGVRDAVAAVAAAVPLPGSAAHRRACMAAAAAVAAAVPLPGSAAHRRACMAAAAAAHGPDSTTPPCRQHGQQGLQGGLQAGCVVPGKGNPAAAAGTAAAAEGRERLLHMQGVGGGYGGSGCRRTRRNGVMSSCAVDAGAAGAAVPDASAPSSSSPSSAGGVALGSGGAAQGDSAPAGTPAGGGSCGREPGTAAVEAAVEAATAQQHPQLQSVPATGAEDGGGAGDGGGGGSGPMLAAAATWVAAPGEAGGSVRGAEAAEVVKEVEGGEVAEGAGRPPLAAVVAAVSGAALQAVVTC